jgi:hypothetical protein
MPFSWFLLNQKIVGVIGVEAKDPNNVKRRGNLNCQTMRADEHGRHTPTTLFFDRDVSTSKLRYHQNHQPKDQCTHAKIFN